MSSLLALPPALQSMERAMTSLHALETVRTASQRDDELRGRTDEYWKEEGRLAGLARRDQEVRDEAARAGLGFRGVGVSGIDLGGDATPLEKSAEEMVKTWQTQWGLPSSSS